MLDLLDAHISPPPEPPMSTQIAVLEAALAASNINSIKNKKKGAGEWTVTMLLI